MPRLPHIPQGLYRCVKIRSDSRLDSKRLTCELLADSWLVEISGSCPLCRADFSQALDPLSLTSASSSSLPLGSQHLSGSTADLAANVAAPSEAVPSKSRIQGFLARVRSSPRRDSRPPRDYEADPPRSNRQADVLSGAGLY